MIKKMFIPLRNGLLLVVLFVGSFTYAQKKQDVLFTVENESITSDEFLRVFNKNRTIVAKENQKTIKEYLDLYLNYKLKLKQAYALGLDTIATYKKELEKYKEQLIKPYLKDAKITESLIKEAYHRVKNEVRARHLLIRVNPKASSSDTLKAYTKILKLRDEILAGKSFDEVAKLYSEDPSAKTNGGDLGYFSAFGMVYPFENAAYSHNVGDVSMPFRTSFGYHIVKVEDKRPSKGEVEVAHIMIKKDSSNSDYAKAQINDIYAKLTQGESFDLMAQKYSDDKSSAPKGGRLQRFSATRMIEPFSSIAFSLTNENEISKPFETNFGWHVVRLLKRYPIASYEELKPELVKKIEGTERAYAAGKSVADKLKSEYSIEINENLKALFLTADSQKITENANDVIFSINGEKTKFNELKRYNEGEKQKSLSHVFEDFLDMRIIAYYKKNLAFTNQEFANTLQEYKDGLLLFDLLQLKIWKRSEKDTLGLKQFFNQNRDKYMYEKRADVIIATCSNENKALLAKQYLEEGKTVEEIKSLMNEKPTIHVLFSKGIVELDNKKLPRDFEATIGVSDVYKESKHQFIVVHVLNLFEPVQKEFKEAKGLVMNDYQEYLEKEWIEELRNKYSYKINKKVLKKLIKNHSD